MSSCVLGRGRHSITRTCSLDMGDDHEIICPYCSTLYRHAADLGAEESRPPECALKEKAA